MDISIVIPVYNEQDSIPELVQWINAVMNRTGLTWETILIDDGSTDDTWKNIESLVAGNPEIKAVRFRRNYGKSAALQQGFEAASGKVVITMDADMQDSPEEIPELYQMIVNQGYHVVSGWKKKRRDPLSKRIPSRFFNLITRWVSGIRLHDFNCGLKAYHQDVAKSIEIYGEMHRYIPLIAKWAGFKRIGEKVVTHHPRKYGSSKYGVERFVNGFLDLISITFVTRFGKKPMHFFGLLGTLVFLAGFCIAGYLAYSKFFYEAYRMTDRPLFYFGLLAMILGTQLFLTGFLADLVTRNAPDRNKYLISARIGLGFEVENQPRSR